LNAHLEEEIGEAQCGFREDVIFTIQQIIIKIKNKERERERENNLPLTLLFIHYEKAYNNMNRNFCGK